MTLLQAEQQLHKNQRETSAASEATLKAALRKLEHEVCVRESI